MDATEDAKLLTFDFTTELRPGHLLSDVYRKLWNARRPQTNEHDPTAT